MRLAGALALAAAAMAFAIDAAPANAQPGVRLYPWCAQYNLPGGPTSCRFSTFEQCLPEVRGVGGQCVINPYYAAYGPRYSAGKPGTRRAVRKRRRH